MALNDLMSNGVKTKKIHIDDIRLNKLNNYPLSEIEELEKSILEYGQLENGIAYEEDCGDNKKYTLLSGHRRCTAIKHLYDKGLHDGMVDVRLEQKPSTIYEEKKKINHANLQRKLKPEEIQEIRKSAINLALQEFERRKGTDEEIKFNSDCKNLSEWVGKEVGISGRQVRTYLKQMKEENNTNNKDNENNKNEQEKPQYTRTQVIKELLSIARKIDKLNDKITTNELEIIFEGNGKKCSVSTLLNKESERFNFFASYIEDNRKGE